ncbi:hypothetical protein [Hyphomicrobium denitrificans]|uniref:hypothetical protein n=1 Tax=Hyphomicrobium denitrificans TaxID=53399 RepID=UPI0011818900|nr:hypothetical protein [Hyphomicrobium denitrificans]
MSSSGMAILSQVTGGTLLERVPVPKLIFEIAAGGNDASGTNIIANDTDDLVEVLRGSQCA